MYISGLRRENNQIITEIFYSAAPINRKTHYILIRPSADDSKMTVMPQSGLETGTFPAHCTLCNFPG
jgi:hypothetical protein